MSVVLVQKTLSGGFGGLSLSFSKSFGSNTVAGNLILVGIGLATQIVSGLISVTSVTDSQGNPYSQVPNSLGTTGGATTDFGDLLTVWFYANNIIGGAATVTANFSVTAFPTMEIYEFSGVDSTTPVLGIAATATSTSISAGTINVTRAGSYGLCQSNVDNGTGSSTFYTAGSGWTLQEQFGGGSGSFGSESQSISSTGNITGNFTGAGSSRYTASMIIIQPPGATTTFFSRPMYGSGRSVAFGNVSGGG